MPRHECAQSHWWKMEACDYALIGRQEYALWRTEERNRGYHSTNAIQATEGNGEYCEESKHLSGELFDAQGGLYADNTYIMNVGDFGFLGGIASY